MAAGALEALLDQAQESEVRLEQYYAAIRDRSRDNSVRLLTFHLARHRRHQEEALRVLQPADVARVRGLEIRSDTPFPAAAAFRALKTPAEDVTGNALLHAAIDYDTDLLNFYRRILAQPLQAEAVELLKALICIEERDIVILRKLAAVRGF